MKILLILMILVSCKNPTVDRQELLEEETVFVVKCFNGYVWQIIGRNFHPYPSYKKQETCSEYNTRILNYVNLEQE
jgi:hypothetical protein